jgi:uncharacterized alpha/beta hydrolase family protein
MHPHLTLTKEKERKSSKPYKNFIFKHTADLEKCTKVLETEGEFKEPKLGMKIKLIMDC